MKVLQVETIYSSGGISQIVLSLMKTLKENGHHCRFAYGREGIEVKNEHLPYVFKMEGMAEVAFHFAMSRVFDRSGFYSHKATLRLISYIEDYQPDIIHLHSLLGYYINVKLLFEYLSKAGIPVIWTHHDCWAFTGRCIHFAPADCTKWMTECHSCPLLGHYPKSYVFDNSKKNYIEKKRLFTSVKELINVAPSNWLAGHLSRSFLSVYPIKVIPNGIDLNIFKFTDNDIKKRYYCDGKTLLLAVASTWAETKGLCHIYKLFELIDRKKYSVAVIGLSDKQLKQAPEGIIALKRINIVGELARWYSAADVFLNPTTADNFPTVNIEALACGTPIISFDTGGCSEIVGDCGMVIGNKNAVGLYDALTELEKNMPSREKCRERAMKYDQNKRYLDYIKLYEEVLKQKDHE